MPSKITNLSSSKLAKRLIRLFELRKNELDSMYPTPPYQSIKLPNGMPPLPDWLLKRLDAEVSACKDFVEITDSHYSHNERYLDYDSREGNDYDEIIDFMLDELNQRS